jgi:hypothetical protein
MASVARVREQRRRFLRPLLLQANKASKIQQLRIGLREIAHMRRQGAFRTGCIAPLQQLAGEHHGLLGGRGEDHAALYRPRLSLSAAQTCTPLLLPIKCGKTGARER